MTRAQICSFALSAWVGICFAGSAAGQAAGTGRGMPLPGPAMDEEWTDAYNPGSGVVMPRLLREVRPNYTADAMREKIAGNVVLQAVVETDGTIRRVRVTRSLDTRFGLDEQAVAALKQWRFQPGTKDGKPVPVAVRVDLTFALRERSPDPASPAQPALPSGVAPLAQAPDLAPVQWPDGFADTPLELAASESIRVNDVEVLVRYPMDWTVLAKTTANVRVEGGIVTLHHASSSLFLTVMAPRAWTSGELKLMTAGQLEALMKLVGPGPAGMKLLDRGQAWNMGGPVWFWTEYTATLPGFFEMVPRRLVESLGGFSSARVWGFFGVTGGQFVNVNCAAAERSGETEADRSKRFAQMGVACGAMLRQMIIRPMSGRAQ